jgi:3-oxoacyl-[acyl-carrier protein] reductase
VVAHLVDVRDRAAVRDFVQRAEVQLGPVSVAAANAGVVRDQLLVLMSGDDWTEVLSTNLDGAFHLCQAAAFSMVKRRTGCASSASRR